jgi:hypothetical protein
VIVDSEAWRDIPGFEGAYQVSDLGRVRSLDRMIRYPDNHPQFARGRILRPHPAPSGHHKVGFGHRNLVQVHALVMLAFVGPYPEGLEIRHLNGIPSDNRLVNLEYATQSRNLVDLKWHSGRIDRHLTPRDILDIKRRLGPRIAGAAPTGQSAALAREYNVSRVTISDIWRERSHKDITLGELGGA